MRSAERLACPGHGARVRSVGTYVLPAYRSPTDSRMSLMRTAVG